MKKKNDMLNNIEIKKLPRLHNIEFLRIFFTFCIFACHALNSFHVANDAKFAVEFFFVLSGFFLTYTYHNHKNLQIFMLNKIIRFLPIMIFGQVVCDLITLKFSFQNYISLICFLPGMGLTNKHYFSIGGNWYIGVLFWVSAFYFYLLGTRSKHTKNIIMALIIYISAVAYNQLPSHIEISWFPCSLFRGFICIGLGCFLELTYNKIGLLRSQKNNQNQKEHKLFFTLSEIVLIIYLLLTMFASETFPVAYIHRIVLFLFLISLFLLRKGCVSQYFDDNSWSRISKYCLSFFLTHQIVTEYLYTKINLFNSISTYSSFLIMFFACVCLSVFAYHVVEKPCATYLKRWQNNQNV